MLAIISFAQAQSSYAFPYTHQIGSIPVSQECLFSNMSGGSLSLSGSSSLDIKHYVLLYFNLSHDICFQK